ncbi:amidohydrolase [Nocardia seriolae]|uniref:amidohydrolase n=2 Tax=Nocardia seriolae TaxID=37332 RepID=UPI001E4B95C4|nr:amidohydrolase [Nocardia seriolae]
MTASPEHWQQVYRHLHAHPELSGQEHATARLVAEELRAMPGWEVTENVGGTGVVGVLHGGPGPVVWLRADMDALPVQEETGLDYASTVPGVMHACGHDVHVTALLGACAELAANPVPGTVVALFQPAEETGAGAQSMINDGLLERFPHPRIVLGQHVSPLPAGIILSKPGTLMAASDSVRVTFLGKGGHASQPHTTIDPLLMAASLVVRLQALTARQTATAASPVLTAGALHAGTRPNIVAESSELLLSLRTFTDGSRNRMIEGIVRMAETEAAAAGAPQEPKVEFYDHFPVTENPPPRRHRARAVRPHRRRSPRHADGSPHHRQRGLRRLRHRRPGPLRLLAHRRHRPGPLHPRRPDLHAHRGRASTPLRLQPLPPLRPRPRPGPPHRHHGDAHRHPGRTRSPLTAIRAVIRDWRITDRRRCGGCRIRGGFGRRGSDSGPVPLL